MKSVEVCDRINGTYEIVPGPPQVTSVSEAVYLPRAADHQWGTPGEWGLYDPAGSAIEAGCNFRGPKREPISQSMRAEIPANVVSIEDDNLVYVGHLHQHFGHFITTSLGRFWQVHQMPIRPPARLLYHDGMDPEHLFENPYRSLIFRALGLQAADFAHFRQPVRIHGRITIPEPSFVENAIAHEAFGICARAIGKQLIGSFMDQSDRPIYLSKSRLGRGFRGFVNEFEIEGELAVHGVRVIYPEEHAFDELLRILSRHSRILGSLGSAFHATAYLPGGKRLVALNQTSAMTSNFLILDKISRNRATYVYPRETEEQSDVRFGKAWKIHDPKLVAAELLELAYGPEVLDYAKILVHVRTRGNLLCRSGEWCPPRDLRLWIEGFAIQSWADTPTQGLEYAAVLNDGSWSPWFTKGAFCGTRGQHAPLRGVRFRLNQAFSDSYEISCESLFADGTIVGPLTGAEVICQTGSGAVLQTFKLDLRRR